MNRFKFEGFKLEFPCLQPLLVDRNERAREARHCDEIRIKHLDREFLNSSPTWNSWDGSLVGISKKETISFQLSDGSLIVDGVYQVGEHRSNYAHTSTAHESGETVLEAIDRHDIASKICMIIVVRTGFTVLEHFSGPNFSVCIYKAGKGELVADLIATAATAALEEARAEANF